MNAQEIRRAYLDFFAQKQHTIIPRALLVPQNDPTTLFTGSGMQPLLPYLLGEEHPQGTRLVDSQTCLRAEDIEEVGDNRHTTFFEMLGNWSLGDYTKEQQIPWMFEFLTDVVKLDINRLYVTCFIGAPEYDIPKGTEAAELWQKLFQAKGIEAAVADIGSEEDGYVRGIRPGERIFYYDGSKNWWNRGKTGPMTTPVGDPCGPDSEMFYDFGTPHDPKFGENCHPNCDCGRFMEIGNNVFMAYRKEAEGKFVPLAAPNIDHGSGLERIAAAAINSPDAFRISLFWPIIESLEQISGKTYTGNESAMRVIADHLRAAMFLAVDGVVPSNKEQGYVMRRLMRRAIRFALDLDIGSDLIERTIPAFSAAYADDFPEVRAQQEHVMTVMSKEEKVFRQTLRAGVREFQKMVDKNGSVNAEMLFKLYDTYGFPVELSIEEAFHHSVPVDATWDRDYQQLMNEQRQRSRTAAKGQFKGGLEGHDDIHKQYHTATHLMYKALRLVLGDHVIQRGSNITDERLRFDFSHDGKMTPEQIAKVERIVNEQIDKDLKVFWKEYPTQEAFDRGAMGAFGDKYGDTVKVYQMGEGDDQFSFEICGGPHVDRTGELSQDGKQFKILKEEASSAGVRRIKASLA